MPRQILPHDCYLTNLENALATFSDENLAFYDQDLQLFKLLNLDSAASLFEQTYSHTGALEKNQPDYFDQCPYLPEMAGDQNSSQNNSQVIDN